MPYVSAAQRGYFHAHKAELEKQGVNVNEWDQASKGQRGLPEHTDMKKEKGTEAMTEAKPLKAEGKSGDEHKSSKGEHHKKAMAPKGAELHSITTRKLHDGTFAHEHHYQDKNGLPHPKTHEYSSADIEDVKDHMQEHMGGGDAQPAGDQGEGEEGDEQDSTGQTAAPQASAGGAGGEEEEE